ncbi:MAG: methyl-accepting chemotaxis protein [bacterium]
MTSPKEGEKTQAKEKFQRKTILVKKDLQYRYMALMVVSVLVGFLIVGLEISWTLSRIIVEHPMLLPLLDRLAEMLPLFGIKMLIYMGIVLIVSGVISHRMAGPVFKFEKSAQIAASGDLTHRVYLRQGDQLMELQNEFNLMMGSLQEKVKKDRQTAAEIAAGLDDIPREEIRKKLSEITSGFMI